MRPWLVSALRHSAIVRRTRISYRTGSHTEIRDNFAGAAYLVKMANFVLSGNAGSAFNRPLVPEKESGSNRAETSCHRAIPPGLC